MMILIGWSILVFSLALLAQSLFSLYLMMYTWWQPDRLQESRSPAPFESPRLGFTVLLPARHEKDVIYRTVRRVLDANYPEHLMQVLVICEASDHETIVEAHRAFELIDSRRVAVLTFDDGPINKPHGLNIGLRAAANDIVTVFDAEDDLHPDIFNIINTIMTREDVRVVQAGVQLMNYRDHWFSALNVMEYFFWFRSRLHFHAQVGMIPLGGNTVFASRHLLEEVGGWDERCLTEDADLGVRLSVLGEPIRVVYDPEHVTREETPDTLGSFIKQRTRWNQGFLQVLLKRDWLRLPSFGQRALALYTLSYPLVQGALLTIWPLSLAMLFVLKLPVPFALPALSPLYAIGFQFFLNFIGLWEFTRLYKLRFAAVTPLTLAICFLPFQFVLGFGALRAVYRELRGHANWEKTEHIGAHRVPEAGTPLLATPGSFANQLLETVLDRFDPSRASVLVRNGRDDSFSILASRGLDGDVGDTPALRLGEGIAGWVAERGTPLIIGAGQPHVFPQGHLCRPELHSSIVFPVRRDDRTVAVINVGSTTRQFTDEDVSWLERYVDRMLLTEA